MVGEESSAQGVVRNMSALVVSATDPLGERSAFPLNFIVILKFNLRYRRWKQNINNWLILNNLVFFNAIISHRTYIAIFYRLEDNDRELVEAEFDDKDSQIMLDVLVKDY